MLGEASYPPHVPARKRTPDSAVPAAAPVIPPAARRARANAKTNGTTPSAYGPAVDALLIGAVDEAARLLDADGAMVYLLDPGTDILRFAFDAGIESEESRRLVRWK